MSVRRLAEPEFQPADFAFNKANAAAAKKWIAKYPKGRQQSAIIPLLMLAQDQEGWVTKAAIESVCDMLDMPYIRGLEVATFYTQYQLKPVGTRAHIQVCGTTPCMLRGAGELMDVCRSKIHPEQFHTNEDGTLSWEEVECLGACVNAPMIMVFKDTYEDLTPERLAEIIDAFEAGKGDTIEAGPQIDRFYSAPQGGFTSLADEKAVLKSTRAKATGVAKAAQVPPSKAARHKTDAAETNEAVQSPSPVKASAKAEKAAGTAKPSLDHKDRPKGIDKPTAVDDLKLISGIGPKNEAILHELGIYTFAQVASWKKAERGWVDAYLNFHGRIEREDWVKQAKALAKGGVAEYTRVFGKKPV
ncbi:NADH-quinone oxidoreductase subunit NuoE [Manganibacter manganicus]|uniref:NADH-quinone oxidoreductase subunit E n=1 Tax=Manganibacter manganicus TaxID=1873176 RepID=A0A1V8RW37_9HYPH|nr:NADH-quinone oxidoreductase subunit NuoE [Pseudaminobacter manganicus]OQM77421.1 NADH-quinone oxidoreductase subunit E [Pseudaminobacter manganicus]